MELSIETRKDIREVFKDNQDLINILLSSDIERENNSELRKKYNEEVSKIQAFGYERFSAEEVMECCEIDTIDYLYNKAKKKVDYARVYSELIGNGPNPYTIDEGVGNLFDDNNESKEELLSKDAETIKLYERYGYSGFTPQEIIKYKESDSIEELYKKAKKKSMFLDLYYEAIGEKRTK